jgi:ABC-type multidrug transport system fused ATPase/permease subunit
LDPFEEYDDQQIWTALDKANLKKFVENLENTLLFECLEGGENLRFLFKKYLFLIESFLFIF